MFLEKVFYWVGLGQREMFECFEVNITNTMLNQTKQASQSSSPQTQSAIQSANERFLTSSKQEYARLKVDFQVQADFAIAISIVDALQKNMKKALNSIEKSPTCSSPTDPKTANQQLLNRCLSCSARNHTLLVKILKLKEELVSRMYMGKNISKSNELQLNPLLVEIRRAKMEIRDKLRLLQVKRLAMRSLPSNLVTADFCFEDEDYNQLRNGLELLGKESYELWRELHAQTISPLKKPK